MNSGFGATLVCQGNQIISEGEIYPFSIKLNILLYVLKEKVPSHSVLFLFLIKGAHSDLFHQMRI